MDVHMADTAMPPNQFFFIRHGETDWNKDGLAQGQADIPLNELGRAQADRARPLLAGHSVARIVTSPLQRASETAEIVNRSLAVPVETHPGLMERSFGPFEGKPFDKCWYESGPGEGAEILSTFVERVVAALAEALDRPGPILVVSHGGVFRVFADVLSALSQARSANRSTLSSQF